MSIVTSATAHPDAVIPADAAAGPLIDYSARRRPLALRLFGIYTPGASNRRLGLAIVGLGLFAYFGLRYDNFVGSNNIVAIGLNVSAMTIAAVGTMMLLVSGNVDLSIGSQYALISLVTAWVVRDTENALLGVAAALGVGLLLGALNGLLVVWLRISPLIVTVGTMAIFRGFAFVLGDGVSIYGFPDSFTRIGRARWWGIPVPVMVAALVFVVGTWILLTTVTGLRLYALGGNRESSRLVGLSVNSMIVRAFATNGVLIGLAALLTTSRLGSGAPNYGLGFEMAVLTAVILGGVAFNGGAGHPIGVLIGVCTIGVLDAGLIFAGLQDWWQQVARGLLLLLALASDQLLVAVQARRRGPARAAVGAIAPTGDDGDATPLRERGPVGPEVLAAHAVTVRYDGVPALEDAELTVHAGEVVCVVGDNGAGKSTLIRALCGVEHPTDGTIRVDGADVTFRGPSDARRAGIETVFQGLALCENLGAAHNLVLGEEPHRRLLGVVPIRDDRRAAEVARLRLAALGVEIDDPNRPVARFSGGQRQCMAIARVLHPDVRVVILDEPTAALGVKQTGEVLQTVRRIADAGHGVVLISHDVEDIFEVADRVVVLQLGRVIFTGPIGSLDRLGLLRLMSGRTSDPGDRAVP